MSTILEIKGNVRFNITLDPGVWIFDDRRIDLDTYFSTKNEVVVENSYQEKMSQYFNREIREGSITPPTLKTERKYQKEKVLNGTFGIKLEPFLNNAEPNEDAKHVILETKEDNVTIPLKTGKELLLKFSHKGKPLKEDGPIHVFYADGSNQNSPIKNVTGIIVE